MDILYDQRMLCLGKNVLFILENDELTLLYSSCTVFVTTFISPPYLLTLYHEYLTTILYSLIIYD